MKWLSKLFITVILFLICLILIKSDHKFKSEFYVKVYEDNFNFAYINTLYQKYFGSSFPLDIFNKTEKVFSEKLVYENSTKYLDGVSLEITDKYLVPSLNTGLVIFVGEKENYGKTVIVGGSDGIDIWYSNMELINVKLYDYISSGTLIGEASKNLYLVFKKDGEVLDYNEYIN